MLEDKSESGGHGLVSWRIHIFLPLSSSALLRPFRRRMDGDGEASASEDGWVEGRLRARGREKLGMA